jgi:membrane protein implicated in regulation of membrane protease activity
VRLLPVTTGLLTTAAASLWAAAILASADARTLSDLRSGAITATILSGVAAAAWRAVAELANRDCAQRRREQELREDRSALIRVIDNRLGGAHPSGPFSAVR